MVLVSLATGALMVASTQAAAPSPVAAPQIVRATIWPNLVITFSPNTFKRGTVALKVRNRAPQTHQFAINGVTSPGIRPNATVMLTVTFKRRAVYSATLPDCGYPPCIVGGNNAAGTVGTVKVT